MRSDAKRLINKRVNLFRSISRFLRFFGVLRRVRMLKKTNPQADKTLTLLEVSRLNREIKKNSEMLSIILFRFRVNGCI